MKFVHASGSRPLAGFTLRRGLGRGGFGEVYQATSDAGKEVALKLIQRSLEVELRGVSQCINLKSPHLVEIYDVQRGDDDEMWVVMEYVSGPCLSDVLERAPNGLPPAEVERWMRGILQGVNYLHDHGIVHRDLKPGNLFDENGLVKIGDYGLSKFISASRRSGHTESIGTVHYIAPEVVRGRYGREVDLYAVGVMLFEMLTGRVPFEGESVGEILMKHLSEMPDVSMLPPRYQGLVARCLEKDPAKRYATASDVLAALDAPPPSVAAGPATGGAAANGAPVATGAAVATGVNKTIDEAMNLLGFVGWKTADAKPAAAKQPEAQAAVPPVIEVPSVAVPPVVAQAKLGQPAAHAAAATTGASAPQSTFEEPLARAIATWWLTTQQNPPAFTSAVITLALAAVFVPIWLWIGLAWMYCVYYLFRMAILAVVPEWRPKAMLRSAVPPVRTPSPVATAQPRAVAEPRTVLEPRGMTPARRPQMQLAPVVVPWQLPPKTTPQRATELLGSLVTSAGVIAVLTALAGVASFVLSNSNLRVAQNMEVLTPEQLSLLGLVGLIASWTVLLATKRWEGTMHDVLYRRFVLGALGAGVGAVAYTFDHLLWVNIPGDTPVSLYTAFTDKAYWYHSPNGGPTLVGYMAFFATLLFLLRWWKQTDPLRMGRFRLGPVVVVTLVAAALSSIWTIPNSWGVVWAVMLSMTLQIASPYQREAAQKWHWHSDQLSPDHS